MEREVEKVESEPGLLFEPEMEEEKHFDLISGSVEWTLDEIKAELARSESDVPFLVKRSKVSSVVLSEK